MWIFLGRPIPPYFNVQRLSISPTSDTPLVWACPAQSIVLHNMTLSHATSDFAVPVGMKITGVDNKTFSLTGESFSHVLPANTSTNSVRVLQADDVALGV